MSDFEIDCAMQELYGYWKTTSILFLKKCSIPTLDMLIITKWCEESRKELECFSQYIGNSNFIFRHDKNPEIPNCPRGWFTINVKDDIKIIEKFLSLGRIVLLLSNAPFYNNGYNINAIYLNGRYVLEILGPGFDASDLQRGDQSPHQVIWLNEYFERTDMFIISNENYKKSVVNRLKKIRIRIEESNYYKQLVLSNNNSVIRYLKKYTNSLLVDNLEKYICIPSNLLQEVLLQLKELNNNIKNYYFFYEEPYVISFSFLEGNILNAWDVVFPSKKYETV